VEYQQALKIDCVFKRAIKRSNNIFERLLIAV